ncbi:MAG TPA: DUF3500 domain-containing protein [Vicinamibacterales bacterium]|jgi:hypothetical protein
MHSPTRIVPVVALALGVGLAVAVVAQQSKPPAPAASAGSADATARVVASAQALLKTLDDAGRQKVQFAFDSPQKTKWSNLPSGIFTREGIRLADLSAPQRAAVMSLLSTALSPMGYQKVQNIMEGDEVLRKGESGGRVVFGRDEYYLAFVGVPSTTEPWMLQFGGHHLAINLTMGGSAASMTPSLPAAQPASFTVEGRTIRPLGAENDKAFALVNALTDAQRGQAILKYRVADLVLGPGQDGRTIQPEGVPASSLTPAQQTMLVDLIQEWSGIMTDAYATPRMAEIKANLPQTYFAWSGPTTNGSPAYFRIQGPTLVIEYAPQGGSVDHIHTIYRDPTNDYGAKLARK